MGQYLFPLKPTLLPHPLQMDVILPVPEMLHHGIGEQDQLLGRLLPMLRPRFVDRLYHTIEAGAPDLLGRGELVRFVEEGSDGSQTQRVADGTAQYDGADQLLKRSECRGGVSAQMAAAGFQVFGFVFGPAGVKGCGGEEILEEFDGVGLRLGCTAGGSAGDFGGVVFGLGIAFALGGDGGVFRLGWAFRWSWFFGDIGWGHRGDLLRRGFGLLGRHLRGSGV